MGRSWIAAGTLPGGMGSVNAADRVSRRPVGWSSAAPLRLDRWSGQRAVRQSMNAPHDGTHVSPRDGGGSVSPAPSDGVAACLEGGLRPHFQSRHDGSRRVTGLEPEKQMNAVRERPHTDRLGVEPPAQGDDVALHYGDRFPGNQWNPAQGGPHEVAVEPVRGPPGNAIHEVHVEVHVRKVGRRLIGGSSPVRPPPGSSISSSFIFSRTTEALHDCA